MKEFFLKIYNWLKAHKLAVIILITIIVAGIMVFFLQPSNKDNNGISGVPSTPSPVKGILKSPNVYPNAGEASLGGTTSPISLFFDSVIDLNTVKVTSTPSMSFRASALADYPTRVILNPSEPWKEGVHYKITIQRGVQDLAGEKEMRTDLIIEYDITKPDLDNFISPE